MTYKIKILFNILFKVINKKIFKLIRKNKKIKIKVINFH